MGTFVDTLLALDESIEEALTHSNRVRFTQTRDIHGNPSPALIDETRYYLEQEGYAVKVESTLLENPLFRSIGSAVTQYEFLVTRKENQ